MAGVLDIDLGNTRLKWRWLESGQAPLSGAIAHESGQLAAIALPGITPARVRLASVVAESKLTELVAWCRQTWQLEPEIAQVGGPCAGVSPGYTDPTRLGVDRWLAVLAAYHQTGGACVVVSCGTAMTVDLVDSHGRHLGGYIVPGMELMRRALFDGTHAVKVDDLAVAANLQPGHDTAMAVRHGLLLMQRGLLQQAAQILGEQHRLVITGGDAERLLKHLPGETVYNPNLVLDGLAYALP